MLSQNRGRKDEERRTHSHTNKKLCTLEVKNQLIDQSNMNQSSKNAKINSGLAESLNTI